MGPRNAVSRVGHRGPLRSAPAGYALATPPCVLATAAPHSGQRSGDARRSYPQSIQSPCVRRTRSRTVLTMIATNLTVGKAANRATKDQWGSMSFANASGAERSASVKNVWPCGTGGTQSTAPSRSLIIVWPYAPVKGPRFHHATPPRTGRCSNSGTTPS